MRICSFVLIIIAATALSVAQVGKAYSETVPSKSFSESSFEGWLDIVASDGFSRIYLQKPDRSQSFIMAYNGETITDTTSQVFISGTVRSMYPSRELVNVTVTDKRSAVAPRPFYMRIKDIWMELNRTSLTENVFNPQSRWVKVIGRIGKSSSDETIYIVENGKKLILQGWFDATNITNNSLVEAVGCLDYVRDEVNNLNLPSIVVNPEGACPLTNCYGSLRQLTP